MPTTEQDTHQIRAVLERYSKSWEAMDWAGLKSIWDPDYAHILYIPEERAEPLRGWAEVEAYFRHAAESVIRVGAMQLSDISIDVFGDTAYAFCNFHFEAELRRLAEPFVTGGRDTFILRRKDAAWKVIHYHESRPHTS
jgi:ketosteroid isomerase-like protein